MMVFKMYLLSNMAILGIHFSFRGCKQIESCYFFDLGRRKIVGLWILTWLFGRQEAAKFRMLGFLRDVGQAFGIIFPT